MVNTRTRHIESRRSTLEFFIQQGLVFLLTDQHSIFSEILHVLDTEHATHERKAALAWQIKVRGSLLYLPSKNYHFILNNRDYLETYILMGGSLEVPTHINSKNTLSNVVTVPSRIRGRSPYLSSNAGAILRNFGATGSIYPFSSYASYNDGVRESLVRSFRYDTIFFRREDLPILVDRTLELFRVAPAPAVPLLRTILQKVWKTIYEMSSHLPISASQLRELLEVVPHPETSHLLVQYGDLFRCANKPVPYLAYLLGMPFHLVEYEREYLISLLQDQIRDPSKLEERLKNYHRNEVMRLAGYRICSSSTSGPGGNRTTDRIEDEEMEDLDAQISGLILNETDCINFEKVYLYSPYDVVRYVNKSGKVVQLVRTEYNFIRRNSKNPWTNETLPPPVLEEMIMRQNVAISHALPEPQPLAQIHQDIMSGNLNQDCLISAALNVPGSPWNNFVHRSRTEVETNIRDNFVWHRLVNEEDFE